MYQVFGYIAFQPLPLLELAKEAENREVRI